MTGAPTAADVQWPGQGRLQVDGVGLDYACWGPPPDAAPTLLLLHEGLGCTRLWRGFPADLAARTGWGVFAWSRAGYGQSDAATLPRPLDYMTRAALQDLPPLLDALAPARCVLFGHSDGATIAAEYAGRLHDARLAGLILMAPHFFTEDIGLQAIAAADAAYAHDGLRARLARYHADPDIAFRGWCDSWLHPDFRSWNVTDALAGITQPVLAIQGAEDQYGTLAQLDALEQGVAGPVTRCVLPGCRHAPHLEAPEAVLSAVADFLPTLESVRAEGVTK